MQNSAQHIVSLGFVAVICLGCGRSERQPGDTLRRPGATPVTTVADDDPKMLAAIEKARSTVDEFVVALQSPKPSYSMFAVKMPLKHADGQEHIWVSQIRFKNGKFEGAISNDPVHVKNVRMGQVVEVPKTDISDWMYVDGRKLVGGYTMRALREILPPNERKEFDKTAPFEME